MFVYQRTKHGAVLHQCVNKKMQDKLIKRDDFFLTKEEAEASNLNAEEVKPVKKVKEETKPSQDFFLENE